MILRQAGQSLRSLTGDRLSPMVRGGHPVGHEHVDIGLLTTQQKGGRVTGRLAQLQTVVQKDFPASVWEIVLSGCQSRNPLKPFYSREEKDLAAQSLERMGIQAFAKRCYRELSGGQQQRVLLARALCATRKCLLLDEPVSGLDPKVTEQLYALIERLHQQGITIIMISHDLSAALSYADHILHIGNQVFFGTKEEYLDRGTGFLPGKGGAGHD